MTKIIQMIYSEDVDKALIPFFEGEDYIEHTKLLENIDENALSFRCVQTIIDGEVSPTIAYYYGAIRYKECLNEMILEFVSKGLHTEQISNLLYVYSKFIDFEFDKDCLYQSIDNFKDAKSFS